MTNPRPTAQAISRKDPGYLEELWLHYWANGGATRRCNFDDHLAGPDEWDPFELRILAWAVEELSPVPPFPNGPGR